jgi:hypothetical protein
MLDVGSLFSATRTADTPRGLPRVSWSDTPRVGLSRTELVVPQKLTAEIRPANARESV